MIRTFELICESTWFIGLGYDVYRSSLGAPVNGVRYDAKEFLAYLVSAVMSPNSEICVKSLR